MTVTIERMTSPILLQFLYDMRLNSAKESRQLGRVIFVQLNIFTNLFLCLHLKSDTCLF